MHRAIATLLVVAALLDGCASMSSEEISSAGTPDLVETAQNQAMTTRWTILGALGEPQDEIIDELARRGEISQREAEAIKAGDLFVGMRAEAVRLVLGPPHRITHVSATASDAESFYYSAPGIGTAEVRLRAGKVISWAMQ